MEAFHPVPSGFTLVRMELPVGVSARKVLAIGIDGLRWDRVEASPGAVRLRDLAAAGLLVTGAHPRDSPARTESGPGWSTLATGVGPAKHGVRRNSFAGARFDRYPGFLTLAARARPGLVTAAVVDWPPLVDAGLFGPEISAKITFDGESHGYASADARVATAAVDLLEHRHPDAVFVYFGAIDEAGHRRGPFSRRYRDAITTTDGYVGRLLDAVAARPTYPAEDWLVLVGTDHGHRAWSGHGWQSAVERAVFVVARGTGFTPGSRRTGGSTADIAVTALDHLGVRLPAEHGFDGRSLLG